MTDKFRIEFSNIGVKNTQRSHGYACVFCLNLEKSISKLITIILQSIWYNID